MELDISFAVDGWGNTEGALGVPFRVDSFSVRNKSPFNPLQNYFSAIEKATTTDGF